MTKCRNDFTRLEKCCRRIKKARDDIYDGAKLLLHLNIMETAAQTMQHTKVF